MKKLFAILVALVLCLSAGYAETEEAAEETYLFVVPVVSGGETIDVALAVDADCAEAIDLLGEPASYFETESCAFQGMDKVYTYPSFVINTYPKDGADMVMSIFLMDDVFTTAEGAYIGMSVDEVKAIYGEPTAEADASVSYEKGGCALAFMYDADGYVTAITYSSIASSAQ